MRRLRALLPLCVGCQLVLGTEDRSPDPLRDGCALPTTGDARLRFVQAVPHASSVDVCVRASGGAYGRPVLRGGGTACPSGFGYGTVSAPFAIPAGRVDVKVIAGGSTCSAPALAELAGIDAPSGSTTSLGYLGKEQRILRAYREPAARPSGGAIHLRLVNGIPNTVLDFGLTDGPRLPASVSTKLLLQPLSYPEATRETMTTSIGRVDSSGYLELPKTPLNLGAARSGDPRAVLVASLGTGENYQTLYALGDPRDALFPVRGLFCDEASVTGLYTNCTQTPLATLSIDAFNVALYGAAAAPEEAARRPKLMEALSTRESDLMCLLQVARREDRDELIARGKATGAFPYSVTSNTDLDTLPTDPRDQSGVKPVRPNHPPCLGTNDPKATEAAFSCLNKCSTTGGPDGRLTSADCVSMTCPGEMITLLTGDSDARRCFTCIVANMSNETLGDVRSACTTDPRDAFGFRGQASQMILSRLPIRRSETYVLPSTAYRRVVQYAEVEIETGKFLDYYCANFTSAYGDLIAYSGYYSGGATGGEAWQRETQLQATRTVEFVRAKSGGKHAIISGDWSASRELRAGDGTVLIDPMNPRVIEILEAAFLPAYPPSFVKSCTECAKPKNPYNDDADLWATSNFMLNFPPTSAVEASILMKEPVVMLSTGGTGPLSRGYMFNSRVLRP